MAWASTQNVTGVANDLGGVYQDPRVERDGSHRLHGGRLRVQVRRRFLGRTAAQLSKKAGGRPVKMFLDRVQEHLAAGNRPSGWAHIKLGANRDGKVVALIAERAAPAASAVAPT